MIKGQGWYVDSKGYSVLPRESTQGKDKFGGKDSFLKARTQISLQRVQLNPTVCWKSWLGYFNPTGLLRSYKFSLLLTHWKASLGSIWAHRKSPGSSRGVRPPQILKLDSFSPATHTPTLHIGQSSLYHSTRIL